MGIQFEKLKKNPTDRPILVRQGRVRGNKTIFKVGLSSFQECVYVVRVKVLVFSLHEIKYIWYLPKNSIFLFLFYTLRIITESTT